MNIKKIISLILMMCFILAFCPVSAANVTSGSIGLGELIYIAPESVEESPITLAPPDMLSADDDLDLDNIAKPLLFGREALSKLQNGDSLVFAYDAIAEGAQDFAKKINITDNTHKITVEELADVYETYRSDHPEHFWVNGGYLYSTISGVPVSIQPNYNITEEQKAEKNALLNSEIKEILDKCDLKEDMSEFEKAIIIHDILADLVVYDLTALDMHDAYGAIVDHTAVCDGYAKAYQLLLNKIGIEAFVVTGNSRNPSTGGLEGHAWNLVKIDGKYYHTDLTWDDQFGDIFYTYFNVTDEQLSLTHVADKRIYPLPECSATDANYYTLFPGKITSEGDIDLVADQLKTNTFARVYLTDGTLEDLTGNWFFTEDVYREIAKKAGIEGRFFLGCSYLGNEIHLKLSNIIDDVYLYTDIKNIVPVACESVPEITVNDFCVPKFADYEISEIHWKKKTDSVWVTTNDKTFDYETEYGIEIVVKAKSSARKSFYSTESGLFKVYWNTKSELIPAVGQNTQTLKFVHPYEKTGKEAVTAQTNYNKEQKILTVTTNYSGKFTVMLIDYNGNKLEKVHKEQVEFTALEPKPINLNEVFPDADKIIIVESEGTLTPLCRATDIE